MWNIHKDRHDRIHAQLKNLLKSGRLESFYCYAPDGSKRWVIETKDSRQRSYSTAEIECVLFGASL